MLGIEEVWGNPLDLSQGRRYGRSRTGAISLARGVV